MTDVQRRIRAELVGRYGWPRPTDKAATLRLLGRRHDVHPRDVSACVYASRDAAEAFAAANREHWSHPSLGIAVVDGGVVGVIDLRPSLRGFGCMPTDPSLPDDWRG